ncbi:radical SAM protein [Phototrophicus methaneseepsis]|uniref:Radical SAM protein n=1 Tax=Phototrophicus methaneseepsis TaxID=2710758 RepID=A0A7S8IFK5_9CHLR|nr:radical SAM protein [Phototrophicus methaneseepsis]QPC83697.1 radical SAM protein [Phototrophicus methaneseepsis]
MSNYQDTVHAPLVLVPQYFGSTVFNRSNSRYYPFDAETTTLLRRAQLEPFEALLAEIDDPVKREQALNFFFHFDDMGFFTGDHYFTGKVLNVEPAVDHLTGPLAVHLEVIAACNLTCTHCFAGELPRREKRLTLKEIERVFEDMAKMGSYRLGLTGGEPLLRKDIFDIVDMATDYGLHPCLTTNGLLITEEVAREFGKRDLVWLNVSLEGASAVTNDPVRGEGTFTQVLDKLKILANHTRFTMAFTVMSTNADEVVPCAELAHSVGASTAVFRPLYPVGTAQGFLNDLMPTFEQYNRALNLLAELEVEPGQTDLNAIDPFSPCSREETQAITYSNHGCGAGNLVCSISVSGDVNPCSFLGSGFVADNVRHRSLSEIWHSSGKFNEIRNYPGGTDETFSGGCRARSLVMGGSANAPDPWLNEREAMMKAPRQSNVTFYDPLDIVRVAGQDN